MSINKPRPAIGSIEAYLSTDRMDTFSIETKKSHMYLDVPLHEELLKYAKEVAAGNISLVVRSVLRKFFIEKNQLAAREAKKAERKAKEAAEKEAKKAAEREAEESKSKKKAVTKTVKAKAVTKTAKAKAVTKTVKDK